jgi:U3 small nucleolar RNA-associated protein 24
MGKGSKTRKFAEMKRMIKARDGRLGVNAKKKKKVEVSKRKLKDGKLIERQLPQSSSAMFFQYNEQLGPPYHVLVDTNFINFSLKNRLELESGMTDCLMAKVTPHVTDCVVAELEKLGPKYRVALRIAQQLGKSKFLI